MVDYIRDLEAVLANDGGGPATVVGHGWGAILACEFAIVHPDRVASLLLLNPIRILTPAGQNVAAQERRVQATDPSLFGRYTEQVWPDIERALRGDLAAWKAVDSSPWWVEMLSTQFTSNPPSSWLERMLSVGFGFESYFAHKGAAMHDGESEWAQFDLSARISLPRAPVSVMTSADDANYVASPEVHAEPLIKVRPDIDVRSMSGVGHFISAEDPGRFAEWVLAAG